MREGMAMERVSSLKIALQFVILGLTAIVVRGDEIDQTAIESKAKELGRQLQEVIRDAESAHEGYPRIHGVLSTATDEELAAVADGDDRGAAVIAYQYYLRRLPYFAELRPSEFERAEPPTRNRLWNDRYSPESAGRRLAAANFALDKASLWLSNEWKISALSEFSRRDSLRNKEGERRTDFFTRSPKFHGVAYYTENMLLAGGKNHRGESPEAVFVECEKEAVALYPRYSSGEVQLSEKLREKMTSEGFEACYLAVVEDRLYAVFHSVSVERADCLAFDLATGDLLWSARCWGTYGCVLVRGGAGSNTIIDEVMSSDGIVYVAAHTALGAYLEGFDAETGEAVFRFTSDWGRCDLEN